MPPVHKKCSNEFRTNPYSQKNRKIKQQGNPILVVMRIPLGAEAKEGESAYLREQISTSNTSQAESLQSIRLLLPITPMAAYPCCLAKAFLRLLALMSLACSFIQWYPY